jgi:hypothetical protein
MWYVWGERRGEHSLLLGKAEGKISLAISKHILQYYMDLQTIGCLCGTG